MTGFVAPEPHWGRDNSDSLILAEQAKALPAAIVDPDADAAPAGSVDERVRASTGKTVAQLLAMVAEGEAQSKSFVQTYIAAARTRSYKAFRNEHFEGSKYTKPRWDQRSKLFKPKTRSMVRKAQAAAAGALFSTQDVVKIDPEDNSNPSQIASAALKQELLNYRLDRSSGRNSIPWFPVSMGAHQDAWIAGICCSRQAWKFRERTTPESDKDPSAAVSGKTENKPARIIFDRPDVMNLAPENVLFDPNCEWTRPAQTSSYLILRFPMPVSDVEDMMRSSGGSNPNWLKVSRADLMAGAVSPDDTTATRSARTGGADPVSHARSSSYRAIWAYENFVRIDGEDYTFWSVGTSKLLSVPQPTRDVHPALFGERPVVIGFGSLETYRPMPMSPVEAVQPLQQEANDVTNLRLDHTKNTVTPLAKVKRGRQIDIDAVQRRSPDGVLLVNDMEDVDWDRPPSTPMDAFQETSILNNDFDELAGTFSQSSVQSNRQLNETVGGMRLLSGAANAVTEFDLRVWVETWVEPVLWQVMKLEEFYEDDEKVLALAGNKAGLVQRFGIDTVTDQLLMDDVTVRVSVGIGASDPMQSMAKFGQAAQIFGNIIMPFAQAGKIDVVPNASEIADEIFGKAGFKNAGDRFFTVLDSNPKPPPGPPPAPPPDPTKIAAIQATSQDKAADREAKLQVAQATLADKAQERGAKVRLATIKASAELAKARLAQIGAAASQGREHAHGRAHGARTSLLSALLDQHERMHQDELDTGAREHAAAISSLAADQAAQHAQELAAAQPQPAPTGAPANG